MPPDPTPACRPVMTAAARSARRQIRKVRSIKIATAVRLKMLTKSLPVDCRRRAARRMSDVRHLDRALPMLSPIAGHRQCARVEQNSPVVGWRRRNAPDIQHVRRSVPMPDERRAPPIVDPKTKSFATGVPTQSEAACERTLVELLPRQAVRADPPTHSRRWSGSRDRRCARSKRAVNADRSAFATDARNVARTNILAGNAVAQHSSDATIARQLSAAPTASEPLSIVNRLPAASG